MVSISPSAPGGAAEQSTVAGLLSRLMDDAVALARNEIALAKAEARNVFKETTASVAPFAGGVLLAGVLTLIAAIVLALAEVMEPWLAALIVGIVLLISGWMLLKAGQRKWERLTGTLSDKFDRTQDSLEKDATVVARRTT